MGKGFTVEVVKQPDWKKKERQGKAGLLQTLVDIGQFTSAEVAQVSPHRTGRMRRSHRSYIRSKTQVDVIGWTPYLPYVLYGTNRMAARNWPKKGVANVMGRVRQTVRTASHFRKL